MSREQDSPDVRQRGSAQLGSDSGRKTAVPPFLTVEETARLFRLSKMTIYRMCGDGQIASTRVGRAYRVWTETLMDQYPFSEENILEVIENG